jgi:hypothetical protein
MKTKPDGTRAHDIMTIGPIPDWWDRYCFESQINLRRSVRALLDRSDGGQSRVDICAALAGYGFAQVDHALAAMVADGVLEQDGEFYRRRSVGGGTGS